MRRHLMPGPVAAAAFALALLPGGGIAQQNRLKDQVSGVWTLISDEHTSPEGAIQQPLGRNPKGILILDSGGRYAMVLFKSDRPRLRSRTPQELLAATKDSIAQFGTWSVDEAERTLTWHREGALIPNFEGTDFKVSVELSGDELKLSEQAVQQNGVLSVTGVAMYRRAK
jgi:hypothetical protein